MRIPARVNLQGNWRVFYIEWNAPDGVLLHFRVTIAELNGVVPICCGRDLPIGRLFRVFFQLRPLPVQRKRKDEGTALEHRRIMEPMRHSRFGREAEHYAVAVPPGALYREKRF